MDKLMSADVARINLGGVINRPFKPLGKISLQAVCNTVAFRFHIAENGSRGFTAEALVLQELPDCFFTHLL